MEKTLAVITVTISDAPLDGDTGSSGSRPTGEDTYQVVLRPVADKAIDSTSWDAKNAAETVLAHELGHVIAHIFHDPTHKPGLQWLANITGDNSPLVPAEKLAWKLGKTMYPKLDKEQADKALASYEVKK